MPQLANLAALPSPNGSRRAVVGFGVSEVILHGPAPDLSAGKLIAAQAKRLASRKAIGSRGLAAQPLAQERMDLRWPVRGMVSSG